MTEQDAKGTQMQTAAAITVRKLNDWNYEVRDNRRVGLSDTRRIGRVITKPHSPSSGWQFIAARARLAKSYPDSDRDYPTWREALPRAISAAAAEG